MKTIRIIELDDDNQTAKKYKKTTAFEAVCVQLKDGDNAYNDATFKGLSDKNHINIFDLGGSGNSKIGLELIKSYGDDDFLYLIPMMDDSESCENAYRTYQLINKPKQTVLVLVSSSNDISDEYQLKEEFCEWFGDEVFNFENLHQKLNNPNYIVIEKSKTLKGAKNIGITVSELAQFHKSFKDPRKEIYETASGDKNKYKIQMNRYKLSKIAQDYVDSNIPMMAKVVKGWNNICVASMKGGTGKSTLADHIITGAINYEQK